IEACMHRALDIGEAEGRDAAVECRYDRAEEHRHGSDDRMAADHNTRRRRERGHRFGRGFAGLRRRYVRHAGHWRSVARVSIVATTDMPGRNNVANSGSGSRTIFTGMRWTTFVKLPVALSGGNSENCAPEAGDQLSTWPCRTLPGNVSTVTRAG